MVDVVFITKLTACQLTSGLLETRSSARLGDAAVCSLSASLNWKSRKIQPEKQIRDCRIWPQRLVQTSHHPKEDEDAQAAVVTKNVSGAKLRTTAGLQKPRLETWDKNDWEFLSLCQVEPDARERLKTAVIWKDDNTEVTHVKHTHLCRRDQSKRNFSLRLRNCWRVIVGSKWVWEDVTHKHTRP